MMTVQSMKETGKMIKWMESEHILGQMGISMRANGKMVKKMERELFFIMMEVN